MWKFKGSFWQKLALGLLVLVYVGTIIFLNTSDSAGN